MKQPPPRAELSEGLRGEIISMRKHNHTFSAIAAELAVHEDTARKVWNYYEKHGAYKHPSRPGRPALTDDRTRRQLKRHIMTNRDTRREPLSVLMSKLNISVCPKTLRKEITVELGMGHRIERRKPWLSPTQIAARLKFAKEHIHWTVEDWRVVIWTDEMGMQTGTNEGPIWVWRYPEEEYLQDCIAATHISGFEKVKIWGAMRYGKLSKGIIMKEKEGPGKLNAKEYCAEIMDGELFEFWISSMEECGHVVVMEDGAPYHKGAAASRRAQYMEDGWIGWGPGVWPSSSPDLNPIENLWHILRSKVRKRIPVPLKKEELGIALQEEWAKLDMSIVNKLCDSMPRRMQAVIDAKGRSTKY